MIFSKRAISLICVLIVISMFMANLLNIIAIDHNFDTANKIEGKNFTDYLAQQYRQITDSPHNLIWFLQISDIHISIFRDPGRISQFQQFCDSTIKSINPYVVLATGDLTDAKTKDNLGSSQVQTEWVYYYKIIDESGVTKNTTWLDIRGNHDNFNIRTINSPENYFKHYSVQGNVRPKSYLHNINYNGVKVAFIGIDACPEPGLRRPFNFIGILDEKEQDSIKKLKDEAESSADHIVWFGHYPTSCIVSLTNNSKNLNLREFIGSAEGSQVYVCGHLHSMGGLVKRMYTKHKKGYLELELGDWKDNRMYRLIAIDHGIFSFVDQKHNTWPLVLVTNPKHAKYILPGREPLQLIHDSTHIRILAFSDVKINYVKVSFDSISWLNCKHKEGPLYTCIWQPELFKKGLHSLHVVVSDEIGREVVLEHPFSLDRSKLSFEVMPRVLLMVDAGVVGIFGMLLLTHVLALVVLRLHKHWPYQKNYTKKILRFWLLVKIDKVFYPLVIYAVYIPFGPWAIGELIDGHIGAIFAWGILIKGVFLPEPFTYMYGSVQLMFVQIPLIIVLAYTLEMRLVHCNLKGFKGLLRNLPFIILLSIQLLLAYFLWLEYGTLSFLLSPLRTWSIFLSVTLWYKVLTLPHEHIRYLTRLNRETST